MSSDAGPSPTATGPLEFSNENMLKLNTHDAYSSAAQAKKNIGKYIPPAPDAAAGTPEATSAALAGLVRAGKNPSAKWLYLCFATPEQRDAAAAAITSTVKSRSKLWERGTVTAQDLEVKHKKGKRERDGTQVGEGFEQGPSVAPWMHLPYDEQLRRKAEHCRGILNTIDKASGVRDQRMRRGDMLETVLPSPQRVGYRNNVQFSCGFDKDGQPTVGFQAGQTVANNFAIMDPTGLPTVHPIAVAVRDTFLSGVFAKFADKLPMYTKAGHTGFWRKLHVRHNKRSEVMLDIEANPTGVTPELLDEVRAELKAWGASFAQSLEAAEPVPGAPEDAKATARFASLQWHLYEGTSTAPTDLPRETLFGSSTLMQSLFDCEFDLSPGAFFQVNRLGTEHLLQRVVDEAALDPAKTVLLDLCCGTGTIGICLAKHVKRVIGVEMVAAAVENAKVNAARNGVTNASYICGKVEDKMREALELVDPQPDTDIVAILDPPRCGVHASVLRALRHTPAVRRIVYISCDQRALETDCAPLCKANTNRLGGTPFKVCNAFGVDLFPQTPHVEMVVAMRRATPEELAHGFVSAATIEASRREREQPKGDAAADDDEAKQEAPQQPSAEAKCDGQ